MDTQELSKRYMEEYDRLVKGYQEKKISEVVIDLNYAIRRSDMTETERLHNLVQEWNMNVSKLEGARIVLHAQFPYLRLPSPSAYSIIFDGDERSWVFNTKSV